jgi:protein arginine N-methyltransferase 1
MSLVLDAHRKYISDAPRVAAFEKATAEVIRPGDVVLDLGSGTGILGLLSCRAGAARVYSIDAGSIIGLAREIAAANGYSDRITFIKALSTRTELPERVDVVVTDQIGRLGFEAGVFEYFDDAIRRFLKPGGRLIPSAMETWLAPVTREEFWQDCEFWNSRPAGMDFSPARSIAGNTGYPLHYLPEQLLATPVCAARADLHHPAVDGWDASATLEIDRPAVLHGIGGWFRAQLSPSVYMTNSPLAADRINRRNVFFPIGQPVSVQPGDRVTARMRYVPAEVTASWKVTVETGVRRGALQRQHFVHSTLLGMLVAKEDLEKTDPRSVPRLTVWGEARRTVLELTDGRRPLAEIERELLRRHPDLFPSLREAAVYVAEVVTRYTR